MSHPYDPYEPYGAMIPVEFVGGPLDGEGEVHPLTNCAHLIVQGHPEGYYSVNPYYPDGKLYWIV